MLCFIPLNSNIKCALNSLISYEVILKNFRGNFVLPKNFQLKILIINRSGKKIKLTLDTSFFSYSYCIKQILLYTFDNCCCLCMNMPALIVFTVWFFFSKKKKHVTSGWATLIEIEIMVFFSVFMQFMCKYRFICKFTVGKISLLLFYSWAVSSVFHHQEQEQKHNNKIP